MMQDIPVRQAGSTAVVTMDWSPEGGGGFTVTSPSSLAGLRSPLSSLEAGLSLPPCAGPWGDRGLGSLGGSCPLPPPRKRGAQTVTLGCVTTAPRQGCTAPAAGILVSPAASVLLLSPLAGAGSSWAAHRAVSLSVATGEGAAESPEIGRSLSKAGRLCGRGQPLV